jgi:hypothetical protein
MEITWMQWYSGLQKPGWTPEPATIGFIWQVLYPLIFFSCSFVFLKAYRGKLPWCVALPFAINLLANLAFTPIQFGLRNLVLAFFRYFYRFCNDCVGDDCDLAVPTLGCHLASSVSYLGCNCDRLTVYDYMA